MRKRFSRSVYNLYNLLNNGSLEKYYQEVKSANEEPVSSQGQQLKNYLKEWGFDPEIENNPLMNKTDIKEYVAKVDINKTNSWAYTGGSYGEPLRLPYSKNRGFVRTATFKYFNELGGYQLGDPYVLIRAKNKSSFLKFLRNEYIFIPHDTSGPKLKQLLEQIRRNRIRVMIGYPTVMYDIALYIRKNPKELKGLQIKSLISSSEALEQVKRNIIHEIFDCSFVDRYSNEEVGLIAQQREFNGVHHVNKFGVYTEIVNPVTLEPVKEGEQGNVVVTDILNDLIPVIRYNTGDLATVHEYKNSQLNTITNIVGRVSEQIFNVAGKPVSPLALGPCIYKPLSAQELVYQYQFAQIESGSYELRIKAPKGQLGDELEKVILSGLKTALGSSALIELVYMDNIEPQPSGKRPVYKNEMNYA